MRTATRVRPDGPVTPALRQLADRRAAAARRLADAVAEFDQALDEGCSMPVLVKLDQEVAAAAHSHEQALAASASAAR